MKTFARPVIASVNIGQWWAVVRGALLAFLLALPSGCAVDAIQLGYDMKEQRMTLTVPIRSTKGYKK